MKVALYARVSTEEQKVHGYSIDAQLSALRAWAENGKHTIIGEYVDAGVSGQKPYQKRPQLLQFMQQLESGEKVDALVFCKLDRFFRSVKLYYQAMDVLDRYHVAWQAIQEDYETLSANGRFKVNIMLSVAEAEVAKTSERIKTVLQHKIDKGEAITRCQPFGYKLEGKKVVTDENADAAREMFEFFARTGNTYATRDMIQNKYGVRLNYESVYRFLQNPMYTGRYRDNPNYCEPLVSQEVFDRVQADFAERRKTKRAPSGRVYLFSGLVVCAECGRKMGANYNKYSRDKIHYRCAAHFMGNGCINKKQVGEAALEQDLLDVISGAIAGESRNFSVKTKNVPTVNKAATERKLARLKELYIDGDISKDEYTAQKAKLTELLSQPQPEKQPNFISVVGDNFREDYAAFTKEQKREFWHRILARVVSDKDGNCSFIFLQ